MILDSFSLRETADFYQRVADKLREAANLLDGGSVLFDIPASITSSAAQATPPKPSIKEVLYDILRTRKQPRPLSELVKEVSLKTKEETKADTVSTILSREKDLFTSFGRNKWGLTEWAKGADLV